MSTLKSRFAVTVKDSVITINGCATRQQLADWYNCSDKTFNRKLKEHGLKFGRSTVLFPKQIREIIDCLGLGVINYQEPEPDQTGHK